MPYPRNPTVETLVQGFQSVQASTIGHLHEEGYLDGIRAMLPDSKLVGEVRTAKIHLPNASVLKEALIQAQAGDVLVIECLGNPGYACWGELRTKRHTEQANPTG